MIVGHLTWERFSFPFCNNGDRKGPELTQRFNLAFFNFAMLGGAHTGNRNHTLDFGLFLTSNLHPRTQSQILGGDSELQVQPMI